MILNIVKKMVNKYSLIEKDQYNSLVLDYTDWVERNNEFKKDHRRLFEIRLSNEYENLMEDILK